MLAILRCSFDRARELGWSLGDSLTLFARRLSGNIPETGSHSPALLRIRRLPFCRRCTSRLAQGSRHVQPRVPSGLAVFELPAARNNRQDPAPQHQPIPVMAGTLHQEFYAALEESTEVGQLHQVIDGIAKQGRELTGWFSQSALWIDGQPRFTLCAQDIVMMQVAVQDDLALT
jgi:hypothetical protein